MELKRGRLLALSAKVVISVVLTAGFVLADVRTVARCTSGAPPTVQTPTVTPGPHPAAGPQPADTR